MATRSMSEKSVLEERRMESSVWEPVDESAKIMVGEVRSWSCAESGKRSVLRTLRRKFVSF